MQMEKQKDTCYSNYGNLINIKGKSTTGTKMYNDANLCFLNSSLMYNINFNVCDLIRKLKKKTGTLPCNIYGSSG